MDKRSITGAAVKQVLKDYWGQYAKHPWYSLWAFFAPAIGTVLVFFVPPLLVARILNVFVAEGISLDSVWIYILLFMTLWLSGEVLWRFGGHYLNKLEAAAVNDLAKNGFKRLLDRDYDFYTNNFVGSLTKTAVAYSRGFELFTDTLGFNVVNNIFPIIFAAVILWMYSPWIPILLIVCLAVALAIGLPIVRRRSRLVAERHMASTRMSGRLSDALTNILAVKSFAKERPELDAYGVLVDDLTTKIKRAADFQNLRFDMSMSPVYVMTNVFGLIAAIFFSQKLGLQIGTVFIVFSYYSSVTRVFWEMNRIYRNIEMAIGEAAEFTQITMDPPQIQNASAAKSLVVRNPAISFKDVSFGYSGGDSGADRFLERFNLEIKSNQKVGLVGPSGGGKTTITKLLLRFIDLQSGSISIDGQDISKVTQESLRSAIAYVPQEPLLFHRSLLENIAYSKESSTEKEVVEVSKLARAHDFISALPRGYETLVGERGVKLSGGQRQRVAIARALLKQTPILVLDEATSSLDSESEKYIQEGLWELMKGKTALVIAHRLSTIKHLDRIVVLDQGRIVQDGTHEELISKPGLYARLWSHQVGEFLEE